MREADDLPLPQRLALSYAPARSRAQCGALLALEERLAGIVRGRREPIASQIRLAWWRERLLEPVTAWPAGEPLLDALRSWRDPAALAALPGAWEVLLADDLTPEAIGEFAVTRATAWGTLALELGTGKVPEAEGAGQWWAAGDLAANLSSESERARVVAYASTLPAPPRLPRELRSLAVLAALARLSLAKRGRPLLARGAAVLRALRTGLTGL